MKLAANPYFNRTTIKEDCDFFGRRRELQTIFSRIGAGVPQSVSIVGERRIGKSSLLRAVVNRPGKLDRPDEYAFVVVDLQQKMHGDVHDFFGAILTALALHQRDAEMGRLPPTYENVGKVVEALGRTGLKLVIILDEFESITRNRNFNVEFFSFLRSLPNNHPVAFLVTSARDLQELCHSKEVAGSPFFNIFHKLNLTSFTPDEANELIIGPSAANGYSLEPYVREIVAVAGYFPFFLQIACCSFFECLLDHSTSGPLDVEFAFKNFCEEASGHFEYIWHHLEPRERKVCEKLCRGEPLLPSDSIFLSSLNRRGYVYLERNPRLFSQMFEAFAKGKMDTGLDEAAHGVNFTPADAPHSASPTPATSTTDASLVARLPPSGSGDVDWPDKAVQILQAHGGTAQFMLDALSAEFDDISRSIAAAIDLGRTLSGGERLQIGIHHRGGGKSGESLDEARRAAALLALRAAPGECLIMDSARTYLSADVVDIARDRGEVTGIGTNTPVRIFAVPLHSSTAVCGDLEGRRVGRFAVARRLGRGGMGEVYLAEDTILNRPVALKRIGAERRSDAAFRSLLLKEAKAVSRLTHPNIAALYDVMDEGGDLFLVMEYVDGETLRQSLGAPMSVKTCIQIGEQCASALAAAHAQNIVHHDIKPENIMVTRNSEIKLLDFGLAKAPVIDSETRLTVTLHTGVRMGFAGTPAYAAPEVLMGQSADHRADIFSLGVVLYEALTGRHPWQQAGSASLALMMLGEPPRPIDEVRPDVTRQIAELVHKCIAKNPADRCATARELAEDLANAAVEEERAGWFGSRRWFQWLSGR